MKILYVKAHQLYRRARRERTFRHRHLRDRLHHRLAGRFSRIFLHSAKHKWRSWRHWSPGRENGRTGPAWWKRSRMANRSDTSNATIGARPWLRGWTRSRLIQQVIFELLFDLRRVLKPIFSVRGVFLFFEKRNHRSAEKLCSEEISLLPFLLSAIFHSPNKYSWRKRYLTIDDSS